MKQATMCAVFAEGVNCFVYVLPVVLLQLLALELLKVLLENSGPTFRSNERFTAGLSDCQTAA